MSDMRGPMIDFKHYDDCNSSGCRGHSLQAILTTSGYLTFKVDGEFADFGTTFDPHEFDAMAEAERLRKEEWK